MCIRDRVLDGGARVRCQPGATVRAVNARLAPYQRALGPDPASEVACTIGGVVANNSSGMACGTTANTYRTLDALRFAPVSYTHLDVYKRQGVEGLPARGGAAVRRAAAGAGDPDDRARHPRQRDRRGVRSVGGDDRLTGAVRRTPYAVRPAPYAVRRGTSVVRRG